MNYCDIHMLCIFTVWYSLLLHFSVTQGTELGYIYETSIHAVSTEMQHTDELLHYA